MTLRDRGETGTAIVEAMWLGVLLLVPLVYVMLTVFDVQRASYAVSAAARSAARAYALAPDEGTGPARARAAAEDQRIDPEAVDLAVSCRPEPGNCLAPGALIQVRLRHQVRLPLAPSALGGEAPSFRVEAAHTVAYGTFREDR